MRYIVQDRQTGTCIDEFYTLAEAEQTIKKFEEEDKHNNDFEYDCYEIKDKLAELNEFANNADLLFWKDYIHKLDNNCVDVKDITFTTISENEKEFLQINFVCNGDESNSFRVDYADFDHLF